MDDPMYTSLEDIEEKYLLNQTENILIILFFIYTFTNNQYLASLIFIIICCSRCYFQHITSVRTSNTKFYVMWDKNTI